MNNLYRVYTKNSGILHCIAATDSIHAHQMAKLHRRHVARVGCLISIPSPHDKQTGQQL